MSKLNELREKRNSALRTAQTILVQDTISSEDRAKADTIFAEVDAMENQISGLERVEKFEAEQRAIPAVPRPDPSKPEGDQRSADEKRSAHRKSMENFVRSGNMSGLETRDLVTSGGAAALVPQAFYPELIQAQKSYGGIVNAVTKKITASGAPMKMAYSTDVANSLVTLSTEQTVPSETDPTLSSVNTAVDEVSTGVVLVSWAEMQDSAFNVDAFINELFGIRFARGLASLITAGNSSNVTAITTATSGATSAGPTAITLADILALYGALDPAYEPNASWAMNNKTRAALMGVVNSQGTPIIQSNPQTGALDVLYGSPIVLNQNMANIGATNIALQYGDLARGYMIRQAGDFQVVRLVERYADKLSVGFLGFARVGGFLTDAGTHPILSLTQHA